jgi:aconitate hydratase
MASAADSFGTRGTLGVRGTDYVIHRLEKLGARVTRLPFSLRVLLENLLRREDGRQVTRDHVEAVLAWDPQRTPEREIPFMPARVLLQDFTGVPAIVDLAAMRDAMRRMGGDPRRINPLQQADLVIDHSVQVDAFGTRAAFTENVTREFERNRERYAFLRWGQQAFRNFRVVPPDTGIVHQVNIEYLAPVAYTRRDDGRAEIYPDTVLGTDSHTTMVNGLGVVGWGVGGIEAEAAMLGQPTVMLIPQVVGVRLDGRLAPGATATDLVLTVTEMLRARGVVGMFVEFYGAGLAGLPIADRATIGNMSPEFGSTCAIFPIDAETLRYMELTGRPAEQLALVEAYAKEQGLWHDEHSDEPTYTDTIELDLGSVEPSIAGPKRPQDRVPLSGARDAFREALSAYVPSAGELPDAHDEAVAESYPASDPPANGVPGHEAPAAAPAPAHAKGATATLPRNGTARRVELNGESFELDHGHVVIAAITSCTNTSNPSVMVGAGILARNAVGRGLRAKPWVKTSLAPGSKVVTQYLDKAALTEPLEALGFNLVGYGCTTCIGNSGPLSPEISAAIEDGDLAAVAVLSGNRNFEGRIHPDVKMNYLASPPLCVAYALAGTMDVDLVNDPLGEDEQGNDVYLRDIWPSENEVAETIGAAVQTDMFRRSYGEVFEGDERWNGLEAPAGEGFAWREDSTYVRHPPYFDGMPAQPEPVRDVTGARVLALLSDSVTTDHISPAGAIKRDGPAGLYLQSKGVEPREFNSYGARRGNHELMMRGTFANIRIKNLIGGGSALGEGGVTRRFAGDGSAESMSIYDAAMRYLEEGTPLVVLAGREYGTGSSRDWAAKGTKLLGVRAVIAQSFERIHRSNLVGMGVLPLQFRAGESAASLGLTGEETFDLSGLAEAMADGGAPPAEVSVTAAREGAAPIEFSARVRIDTPREADYFRHGGILHFVLRQLLAA